ncbi:hypothetical protein BJ973_006247 [Actinoplanes tereljensis]|uniref:Uncharacterized protein n=1 Tax=Paractinoplanes tereljensis TaxID=571912 RepID=A0A919NIA7_9ACTN|nr:hypothetical protein [Actinoplanes tereljensis]GIF19201.1 hypothetical protein Ate02nite_19310 [Actinoplanes tereljensis]
MTSQPQPAPGEGRSAGQYLRPLRDLAAYALVGATAVLLLVAIVDLFGDGFGYRAQGSFGSFINLATIAFPIGAVLLSLVVEPRHPKAQLIVIAAVVEYAVMAVFGLFFGVLIGLINEAGHNGARSAFEGLLVRVAWLAVFAVAAYAVFLIWRNMFYTPRPKPQPGVYGQPQYNQAGAFPGQPGYGPPPGQPGPGQQYGGPPPQPGYPPAPGQPGYAAPGMYGQQPPAWNQPPVAVPTPAPPAFTPPPAEHTQVAPQVAPAGEPTQVVPVEDRTQKITDDRPGYGPADQDPPRQ